MTAPKVCFFPHAEFEDEYDLRNWLDYDLRRRDGKYLLRKAPGLSDLEPGSIVFFHFKGWVVGCAVVEEAKRPTTDDEKKRFGDEWKNVVKFISDSIWAWTDEQFVPVKTVEEMIGKGIGQGFTVIDELPHLLKILQKVAQKLSNGK